MKYRFKIHLPLIGALVSMTACQVTEPSLAETPPAPIIAEPAQTPQVAQKIAPTSTAEKHPTKVQTVSYNGTKFTVLTFDRRDYTIQVVDQKNGPGTEYQNAEAAGKGALAAINGGFFTPEGAPLGLVITNGETRGHFNTASSLGTGLIDGEKLTLISRKSYKKNTTTKELLQTGPRLLWAGEKLTGLSSKKPRARSLLIWDGEQHFGLVHADSATLQGLANNLRTIPLPNFKIKYALNLDGGTSCDLWVSNQITGGPINKRTFFTKKARNYLVLKKR